MNARAKTTLFLLVGLAILATLVAYVGLSEVVRAFSSASPLFLALSLASYALFFLLRGLRWKVLFSQSAPDVRLASTTSATAVGWLANSILPLKGGDVLRAAILARREKVGLATSAATVGLERVLDLIGLALVAALALALLPDAVRLPGGIERAITLTWILPIAALSVLGVLVRRREATVRTATRLLRPFGKLGTRAVAFGDSMLAGLDALARRPALLAKLMPLTLLVAFSQALIFTFLVQAFLTETGFLFAFAGSAVFLLSFVVSITPGNVGTYELAFAAVFSGLGIPPATAIAAAVLTHVTTTLFVAILGGAGLAVIGAAKRDPLPAAVRVAQGGPAR